MERDPSEGGSDVGRDLERDLGDEPPAVDPRHRARLPRADRRVGAGQRPLAGARTDAVAGRRARTGLGARPRPALSGVPAGRDAGPRGRHDRSRDARRALGRRATPSRSSTSGRPACRSSTRSTPGRSTSSSTATTCCRGASSRPRSRTRRCATSRAWSATAPWTDEVSRRAAADQLGHRRTAGTPPGSCCPRSSRTSSRSSARSAGSSIGLPERHLLTAGSLRPGDEDFAALFAEFIVEQSGGADEPIDRRVFELVDGRLVEFAGV